MALTDTSFLKINEIFLSIQGESTWAGMPCVFVRLSGCSRRCSWCDTAYAFQEGKEMSVEDVLNKVETFGVKLVEVTGGEPLEQGDVGILMETLLMMGYEVLLETGGAVDISGVPLDVIKVMDIKCPSSGEESRNLWTNLGKLRRWQDEIKFVILDRADYDYAKSVIQRNELADAHELLLSPVHGRLNPAELADWIISDRLPVRLQLQMHKYIWPNDSKGR